MEWFKPFELGLDHIVAVTKFCLETISVFCVITGLFKTIQLALRSRSSLNNRPFNSIRICFGSWLALALEFQLGSDILATTIAPTPEDLVELALIAVIRTFLNYFLNKELEAEYNLQKQRAELVSERELSQE